ncbi:MAG: DUF192 domain-containing protein [Treponema sp.]|nr:DUF192 domain-containing protein [Treponema sp.]
MIFRFSRKYPYLLSIILFLAVLSSCRGGESRPGGTAEPGGNEKFEKKEILIQGRGGNISLLVEIAKTPSQQQQGLMYRKNLKDGEGMLFVYEKDEVMSFWMKNTLIPLSIAFFSWDGKILEIYNMEPGNLNPVRSSRSVRYALEVPQGWFSRAGLEAGDKLDISAFLP